MGNETNAERDVQLPAQLFEATERLIAGTRFKTVEEFVCFVLQELTAANGTQLDERERKVIEERLRNLGYL
jgi:hypothetical protein